ncbi:hypothetical protein N9L83_03295 [Flavobacteriales bacterium]|nr:hypothetical protein [Flavobacteriales bacterium]
MSARIAIVTTKQPSTNPRMRKSADALSEAGHDVHVLYAFNAAWADETDRHVFGHATWSHHQVGGHPKEASRAYIMQRVRRKWAQWTGNFRGAFNPNAIAYLHRLEKFQPDLVIGHNPGALPILSEWSHRGAVLFDAEDDHPGEFDLASPESQRVAQLEAKEFATLTHISAASPLIGEQYQLRFPHLQITPIDNAFERTLQPKFQTLECDTLSLVWFSQVIGLDRGLQEFLQALHPIADMRIHLTIIGLGNETVQKDLRSSLTSSNHRLSFKSTMPEKELLEELGRHHIGLALETGKTRNRQLCRTNKLFCYPLAGCLTLASHTRSQAQFMEEHPEAGVVFESNENLIQLLREWAQCPEALHQKRKAAWQMGHYTLNWETESRKLIALVDKILQDAQ